MTFVIDTGEPQRPERLEWARIDKVEAIINGVRDALPADATQAEIDAGTVAAVLGDLHTPRVLSTARAHLIALWPLIEPLAWREPAQFDAIMLAYAELATALPYDRSELAARRSRSAQS